MLLSYRAEGAATQSLKMQDIPTQPTEPSAADPASCNSALQDSVVGMWRGELCEPDPSRQTEPPVFPFSPHRGRYRNRYRNRPRYPMPIEEYTAAIRPRVTQPSKTSLLACGGASYREPGLLTRPSKAQKERRGKFEIPSTKSQTNKNAKRKSKILLCAPAPLREEKRQKNGSHPASCNSALQNPIPRLWRGELPRARLVSDVLTHTAFSSSTWPVT